MPKFIPNPQITTDTDEAMTLEFARVPKALNSYMYYVAPNGETVTKTSFLVGDKVTIKRNTLFVIWTPTLCTASKSFFAEPIALETTQNAGSGTSKRYTYIFKTAYAEPVGQSINSIGNTM